jgi:hypothetical protein
MIGNVIILLLEHQSSLNPNMPIRVFIYLGREYEKIIAPDNKELYSSSLLPLPRPEFYVLYNGKKRLKDDNGGDTDFRTYKLSDAFMDAPEGDAAFKGFVELEVPVYDINVGHNKDILERSQLLLQYAKLIAKIREFESQGNELQMAIKLAVQYCIANDILKEYLEEKAAEVLGMLFEEIKVEDLREVWYRDGERHGREEGERHGREEGERHGEVKGKLNGKLEDALKMHEDGVEIDKISRWTGLGISVIEKAINQRSKAALPN